MAIDFQLVSETYVVACPTCEARFDLLTSKWCVCDKTPRSLTCPHCAHCFCAAGARYKERVWTDAPKTLRESTSRFRLGNGEAASVVQAGTGAIPRVLVVDDEEDMRSLVACYVEQMGYIVT